MWSGNGLSRAGVQRLITESLGDVYVRALWHHQIAAGTSGTLTVPTGGAIVLDAWAGGVDALTSESSGGLPTFATPVTAAGAAVTATLDVGGNWILSGEPAAYPVSLLYVYRVPLSQFDDSKTLDSPVLEERHNLLTGLQGGTEGEHYHLTADQQAAAAGAASPSAVNPFATVAEIPDSPGEVGADPAGTAAAAVTAHEQAADPHPGYTTAAEAAAAAPVQSVGGRTGDVTLAKGDVGLGNVDNTADADKPVSTAQQAALDEIETLTRRRR